MTGKGLRIAVLLPIAAAGCASESLEARVLRPPEQVIAFGVSGGSVEIDWSAVDGATAYAVYAANGASVDVSESTQRVFQNRTEFDLHGLDGPLSIVVTAWQGDRESAPSAIVRPTALSLDYLQTDPLILSTTDSGSLFGFSLATGDANGDGFADLLVGAPDPGASGGIELYYGARSGLVGTAGFGDFGITGDLYGWSVAMGDVRGGGFDTLVAGAPGFSGGDGIVVLFDGAFQGPAYSGERAGGTGAALGRGVAVIGDIDGVAGRELALTQGSGTVNYEVHVVPAHAIADPPRNVIDVNGNAPALPVISMVGDYDGDEIPEMFLGMPGYDFGGPDDHGQARVLSLATPGTPADSLWDVAGDNVAGAEFGAGAVPGTFGGDFGLDLVVAAPGQQDGRGEIQRFRYDAGDGELETSAGSAWMDGDQADARLGHAVAFAGNMAGTEDALFASAPGEGDGVVAIVTILQELDTLREIPAPAPNTGFGEALASGDFNGDGRIDLAVGAPRYTSAGQTRGAVFVYHAKERDGPRVDAGGTLHLSAGERFAVSGSTFADAALRRHWRCTWTFGDGGVATVIDPCEPADVAAVFHEYETPGTYQLVLRVERVEDAYASEASTTAYVE